MKIAALLPIALLTGCAITPEIAYNMTDPDLCWALYDQISISGNTERAVRNEVARRGLDCRQMGAVHAQRMQTLQMLTPAPAPVVVTPAAPVYAPPTTATCTTLPTSYGGYRTVCR